MCVSCSVGLGVARTKLDSTLELTTRAGQNMAEFHVLANFGVLLVCAVPSQGDICRHTDHRLVLKMCAHRAGHVEDMNMPLMLESALCPEKAALPSTSRVKPRAGDDQCKSEHLITST